MLREKYITNSWQLKLKIYRIGKSKNKNKINNIYM